MKGIYNDWKTNGDLESKLTLIRGWAMRGVSNDDIANNLGISRSAFYSVMKEHPDVRDACRRGKDQADIEVENSLFKRACGYDAVEEIENFDENGLSLGKTRKTRHIPAEVSAQIFWLKNRAQNRWKDKIMEEEESTIPQTVELKFVDASIPNEVEDEQGNN